ncbi:uncharacterized protein LOC142319100 isoform X2 [Lycorma delicatula]|uniref:uncharacterized protein LOC142319100 isoform X2 n=1 Tax=Lycorma delicatula TaxID=130591 RepID=UPI003F510E38
MVLNEKCLVCDVEQESIIDVLEYIDVINDILPFTINKYDSVNRRICHSCVFDLSLCVELFGKYRKFKSLAKGNKCFLCLKGGTNFCVTGDVYHAIRSVENSLILKSNEEQENELEEDSENYSGEEDDDDVEQNNPKVEKENDTKDWRLKQIKDETNGEEEEDCYVKLNVINSNANVSDQEEYSEISEHDIIKNIKQEPVEEVNQEEMRRQTRRSGESNADTKFENTVQVIKKEVEDSEDHYPHVPVQKGGRKPNQSTGTKVGGSGIKRGKRQLKQEITVSSTDDSESDRSGNDSLSIKEGCDDDLDNDSDLSDNISLKVEEKPIVVSGSEDLNGGDENADSTSLSSKMVGKQTSSKISSNKSKIKEHGTGVTKLFEQNLETIKKQSFIVPKEPLSDDEHSNEGAVYFCSWCKISRAAQGNLCLVCSRKQRKAFAGLHSGRTCRVFLTDFKLWSNELDGITRNESNDNQQNMKVISTSNSKNVKRKRSDAQSSSKETDSEETQRLKKTKITSEKSPQKRRNSNISLASTESYIEKERKTRRNHLDSKLNDFVVDGNSDFNKKLIRSRLKRKRSDSVSSSCSEINSQSESSLKESLGKECSLLNPNKKKKETIFDNNLQNDLKLKLPHGWVVKVENIDSKLVDFQLMKENVKGEASLNQITRLALSKEKVCKKPGPKSKTCADNAGKQNDFLSNCNEIQEIKASSNKDTRLKTLKLKLGPKSRKWTAVEKQSYSSSDIEEINENKTVPRGIHKPGPRSRVGLLYVKKQTDLSDDSSEEKVTTTEVKISRTKLKIIVSKNQIEQTARDNELNEKTSLSIVTKPEPNTECNLGSLVSAFEKETDLSQCNSDDKEKVMTSSEVWKSEPKSRVVVSTVGKCPSDNSSSIKYDSEKASTLSKVQKPSPKSKKLVCVEKKIDPSDSDSEIKENDVATEVQKLDLKSRTVMLLSGEETDSSVSSDELEEKISAFKVEKKIGPKSKTQVFVKKEIYSSDSDSEIKEETVVSDVEKLKIDSSKCKKISKYRNSFHESIDGNVNERSIINSNNSKYVCNKCNQAFLTVVERKQHELEHSGIPKVTLEKFSVSTITKFQKNDQLSNTVFVNGDEVVEYDLLSENMNNCKEEINITKEQEDLLLNESVLSNSENNVDLKENANENCTVDDDTGDCVKSSIEDNSSNLKYLVIKPRMNQGSREDASGFPVSTENVQSEKVKHQNNEKTEECLNDHVEHHIKGATKDFTNQDSEDENEYSELQNKNNIEDFILQSYENDMQSHSKDSYDHIKENLEDVENQNESSDLIQGSEDVQLQNKHSEGILRQDNKNDVQPSSGDSDDNANKLTDVENKNECSDIIQDSEDVELQNKRKEDVLKQDNNNDVQPHSENSYDNVNEHMEEVENQNENSDIIRDSEVELQNKHNEDGMQQDNTNEDVQPHSENSDDIVSEHMEEVENQNDNSDIIRDSEVVELQNKHNEDGMQQDSKNEDVQPHSENSYDNVNEHMEEVENQNENNDIIRDSEVELQNKHNEDGMQQDSKNEDVQPHSENSYDNVNEHMEEVENQNENSDIIRDSEVVELQNKHNEDGMQQDSKNEDVQPHSENSYDNVNEHMEEVENQNENNDIIQDSEVELQNKHNEDGMQQDNKNEDVQPHCENSDDIVSEHMEEVENQNENSDIIRDSKVVELQNKHNEDGMQQDNKNEDVQPHSENSDDIVSEHLEEVENQNENSDIIQDSEVVELQNKHNEDGMQQDSKNEDVQPHSENSDDIVSEHLEEVENQNENSNIIRDSEVVELQNKHNEVVVQQDNKDENLQPHSEYSDDNINECMKDIEHKNDIRDIRQQKEDFELQNNLCKEDLKQQADKNEGIQYHNQDSNDNVKEHIEDVKHQNDSSENESDVEVQNKHKEGVSQQGNKIEDMRCHIEECMEDYSHKNDNCDIRQLSEDADHQNRNSMEGVPQKSGKNEDLQPCSEDSDVYVKEQMDDVAEGIQCEEEIKNTEVLNENIVHQNKSEDIVEKDKDECD